MTISTVKHNHFLFLSANNPVAQIYGKGQVLFLTCEDDNELIPPCNAGWASRCPVEWTGCCLANSASARLMMSPKRQIKPSFSDGKMNSLCTQMAKGPRRMYSDSSLSQIQKCHKVMKSSQSFSIAAHQIVQNKVLRSCSQKTTFINKLFSF